MSEALSSPECFDVAIVGGGLVGASLAVALADTALRVVLIEAAQAPASTASWDERCIALNDASHRIFDGLGLWQALAMQAAPITATHISERGRFGAARFAAADAGLKALGYNTPMRAIGAALMTRLRAAPNLVLRCPARLQSLLTLQDGVQLSLDTGTVKTRLVVAADGAASAVRGLLGYPAEVRDYAQTALVTAVRVQRDPAGVAYERFTVEGPLAMLPKPRLPDDGEAGHPCSLIWTLPTERAEVMKSLPDEEFLSAAVTTFGERLGHFHSLGRRLPHALQRTVSTRLTAPRIVFCGNAAQSLHPVAAQGFNLGLRDVAALSALLREAAALGSDPGGADLLQTYAGLRESDRRRTADFTDQLVRVFSNRVPVLSTLRHWGLLALDLMPPAREQVLRQNLGHLGLAAGAAR